MSNIIRVSLLPGDIFLLTDPDTNESKTVPSTTLHTTDFIVNSAVRTFFLKMFPGKTDWELTDEAEERITSITDFIADYEFS